MLPEQGQQAENENYWQNELGSLGIEPKRKNELNDKNELEALATALKKCIFRITRLLMMIGMQKLTNPTLIILSSNAQPTLFLLFFFLHPCLLWMSLYLDPRASLLRLSQIHSHRF
jgi:hypothetical protein